MPASTRPPSPPCPTGRRRRRSTSGIGPCLAFCEQFVIDVANLDDDLAAAVVAQLGEQGFVDFANALLVVEQRQRLRLVWERVLATGEEPS